MDVIKTVSYQRMVSTRVSNHTEFTRLKKHSTTSHTGYISHGSPVMGCTSHGIHFTQETPHMGWTSNGTHLTWDMFQKGHISHWMHNYPTSPYTSHSCNSLGTYTSYHSPLTAQTPPYIGHVIHNLTQDMLSTTRHRTCPHLTQDVLSTT